MSARRRWISLFVASLSLALLSSGATFAEEEKAPEKPKELVRAPMMWVVEGDTTVYLVGTIHISEPRVHALLPEVEKAFELSDAVYTELAFDAASMGQLQMAFMTMGIMTDGKTLKDVLGEDLHDRAGKQMPAMAPISFFANRKPWVAWFLLLQAQMQAMLEKMTEAQAAEPPQPATTGDGGMGGDPENPGTPAPAATGDGEKPDAPAMPEKPLDWVLFDRADKAGKQVGGLETARDQFGVFEELELESQIAMVQQAVEALEDLKEEKKKDAEGEGEGESGGEGEDEAEVDAGAAAVAQLTAMVDAWLTGDADALTKMVKAEFSANEQAEAFGKAMFDTRNVGMVDKVCAMMKAEPHKTYFIAVGSGHMPGKNGIVEMLEAKGYKVRKVKTGDKIEASKKKESAKEPAKEPAGAGK